MTHLQIKNVPPDIRATLRRRADAEGMTMSDYVIAVLRREFSFPSMHDWLESLHTSESVVIGDASVDALHEARDERIEELVADARR